VVNPEEATGMSRSMRFPSDDVPALPPFTFEIPDGWTADTVPGALCAVAAPAAADGYRTNVIVEITRCPTTIDLDAMVVETTNDEPVLHTEAVELGGQPARLVVRGTADAAWPQPLVQWQVACVVRNGGARSADLVLLTATCEADEAERSTPQIRALVESFAFTPAD
jgi:hypothetical protein